MKSNIPIFGFGLALSILVLAYPDEATALIIGVILSVVLLPVFLKDISGEERSFLVKMYLVGLLIRVPISVITSRSVYLIDLFLVDALGYDHIGWKIALGWMGESSGMYIDWSNLWFEGKSVGYNLIVGIGYYFFGRNLLVLMIINCVFVCLGSIILYKLANDLFDKRVARIAVYLVTLFPSLALWSSMMGKDPLVFFFLVLCMRATLKLGEKFNVVSIVLYVLSLSMILLLRPYVAYIVGASTIISISFMHREGIIAGTLVQVVLIIAAVLFINYTKFGLQSRTLVNENSFSNIQNYRDALSYKSVGSAFQRGADVSTPEKALLFFPIGFAYFMFGPFPWDVRNLRQGLAMGEVVFWWAMIPFVLIGLRDAIKDNFRKIMPIIMFMLALSFIYSIAVGNVGTMYRQRAQLLYFLFIFAARGIVIWQEKKEARDKEIQAQTRSLGANLAGSS